MNDRAVIVQAEQELMDMPDAQMELRIEHTFSEGLYTRTMYIPKGCVVFGKIHKRETLNICAKGDISVMTEKGITRFRAGDVVVSAPGIKKVGLAHEDTVWVNVHATTERDLDKIEDMFIASSYDDPDLVEFTRELALEEKP